MKTNYEACLSQDKYNKLYVNGVCLEDLDKELSKYRRLEKKLGMSFKDFLDILYKMDAQDFKPIERTIIKEGGAFLTTPYQHMDYAIDLKKKCFIEHGRPKHILKFKDYKVSWALDERVFKR